MNRLEGHIRREDYQGSPLEIFRGTFTIPANDPEFEKGKYLGEKHDLGVEFAIHSNKSGRIIINCPGIGGTRDGYNNKYKNLASHMQKNNLGAVIRLSGGGFHGFRVDTMLRAGLEYALNNSKKICGVSDPEILLSGYSMGASAVAADAWLYKQVSRILLLAPAGNMPEKLLKQGLNNFTGEAYIVQGENDAMVGPDAGKKFQGELVNASSVELFMIPNCDHQFRTEKNGRIMSEAPYYAFARNRFERPKFPDPRGGIKLYD